MFDRFFLIMTEELKQHNFSLFLKKLTELGIDTTQLQECLGEQIKNATFAFNSDSMLCGDGTLISTILKILTPFAVKLNNLYPEEMRVNQSTLVKVCLLHQIAKAVRLVPNDNLWEVEKRGLAYKYNPNQPSIKTGLHSLVLAQNFGITFNEEEAEAMTVNDRLVTDEQAKWHSSLLASIVRQASEMTYMQDNNTKKDNK